MKIVELDKRCRKNSTISPTDGFHGAVTEKFKRGKRKNESVPEHPGVRSDCQSIESRRERN